MPGRFAGIPSGNSKANQVHLKTEVLNPKKEKGSSSAQQPVLNHLYFGDCLEVLKELSAHPEPAIDLIYIDPPFNSKRNYNVLFENIAFNDATAQKQAFADTWSNVVYIVELKELAELNKDVYDLLSFLDRSKCVPDSAVAYLTTMAVRIYYMHKVLKSTGSFYLHCDSNMSHYLKLICDMIFGERNFRNDISWQRSDAHNDAKKQYSWISDSILFYTKSNKYTFNVQYTAHNPNTLKEWYLYLELQDGTVRKMTKQEIETQEIPNGARRFNTGDMSAPLGGGMAAINKRTGKPNGWHLYKGYQPPKNGWRYSPETMAMLDENGRLLFPDDKRKRIMLKRYLDEQKGVVVGDIWNDIDHLRAKKGQKSESLGYPTQKPEALLERIILASTNEGDVVADFFCGCGTTVAAAQKLNRQWKGADISHLAIKLILKRLQDRHGKTVRENVKLHGFPKDVASAKMLATETENGRFGFQEWVIEVLLHGVVNAKKTADGGYDGYITYNTDKSKGFALIETKSGNVNVKSIREFIQVVYRQNASAGIFVCFKNTVTKEMLKEAKAAGCIKIDGVDTGIDRIQILTVDDLLKEGKQPVLPNVSSIFRTRSRPDKVRAATLF